MSDQKTKDGYRGIITRWYKNFADFSGHHVVKYAIKGKGYQVRVKSNKLTLTFEFIEDGRLMWTLPMTKKALRKVKKFLNRIGDL